MSAFPRLPTTLSRHRAFIVTLLPLGLLTTHLTSHYVPHTEGASMLPTIPYRSKVILNPWTRRGRGIKAGDVVAARHPMREGDGVVKRVIAMPGDFVRVVGDPEYYPETAEDALVEEADPVAGEWDREGNRLDFVKQNNIVERHREGRSKGTMIRVPAGHVWLSGENAPASLDSRHYGPVPLALITGRVEVVLWWDSLPRWERLRNGFVPVNYEP